MSSLPRLSRLLSRSISTSLEYLLERGGEAFLSLDDERGRRSLPRSAVSWSYALGLLASRCLGGLEDMCAAVYHDGMVTGLFGIHVSMSGCISDDSLGPYIFSRHTSNSPLG
jgi:hypothetical protein